MFFLYDHPTGHLLAIIGEGDVRHLIGDPRDTDLENRRFPYGAPNWTRWPPAAATAAWCACCASTSPAARKRSCAGAAARTTAL